MNNLKTKTLDHLWYLTIPKDKRVWWIQGGTLKEVASFCPRLFQDGSSFRLDEWEKELEAVRKLQVGDCIYNPYRNNFSTIREIIYTWDFINTDHSIKLLSEFIIVDEYGDYIYRPT